MATVKSFIADDSSLSLSSERQRADTQKTLQLLNSLRWPTFVINSVGNTKLPSHTLPPTQQRSFLKNFPPLPDIQSCAYNLSRRLTPTYMFVLLFYVKISEFLGEGPGWFVVQEKSLCNKYWWTNLLYINNFYPKPKVDGGVRHLTCNFK